MFAVPQSPESSKSRGANQSNDPRLSRRGPNLGATRVKRADGTISMPPSPALQSVNPSNLSNIQSRLLQSPASFLASQSNNQSVTPLTLSNNDADNYQLNNAAIPSLNEADAALAMYSLSSEAASDIGPQASNQTNIQSNQSNNQSEFVSSVTEFNAEEEYLLSLVTGSLKTSLKRKRQTDSKPKSERKSKSESNPKSESKKTKQPKKKSSKAKKRKSSESEESDGADNDHLVLAPLIQDSPSGRPRRGAAIRASVAMAVVSDDDSDDSPPGAIKQNKQINKKTKRPSSSSESSQSSENDSDDELIGHSINQPNEQPIRPPPRPKSPPPPPAPRHSMSVRALLKDNKRGELSASRKAALERARVEREAKAAAALQKSVEQSNNQSAEDESERPLNPIVESEEIILAVNSDEEESKYADQADEDLEVDEDEEKEEEEDDDDDDEPVGTLSMAPQMKIVNGQLVLNEDSLFLAAAEAPSLESYTLVHENSTARLTSASFGKHSHSTKWTVDETALFYRSLSQFGTDFDLICQQFPGRNRKQVKAKYKSEERANRLLLDAALTRRLPIDRDQYEKLKQVKIEAETAKKEEVTVTENQRVQLSEV